VLRSAGVDAYTVSDDLRRKALTLPGVSAAAIHGYDGQARERHHIMDAITLTEIPWQGRQLVHLDVRLLQRRELAEGLGQIRQQVSVDVQLLTAQCGVSLTNTEEAYSRIAQSLETYRWSQTP
jgi:hypothetical protein